MAEYEREENNVQILAPEGLGFGEGMISTEDQIERGELSREAIEVGIEIITTSPDVFVPIDDDANDDGCGDGRPASKVFRLIDTATGKVEEHFNRSRRRAKLFGGGLVVASSMWRSVSGNAEHGETVYGDRVFMADALHARQIEFGAHTDNHAEGEVCGCGAIDKYPLITMNAAKYKDNILNVLGALYGEALEDNIEAIDSAFKIYEKLAENTDYFSDASGKKTMDLIMSKGAIVKELDDKHLEDFIVLNDVENTTFDQRALDRLLKQRGVFGEAQAFVVDTWRGRMYAEAVADVTLQSGSQMTRAALIKQAYADFLIRTLAVSATLTKNDLPVIGRTGAQKSNFAFAA